MKIVLYEPQIANRARYGRSSLDLLPLELMHVAALPLRDGHEVVLIDGSLYEQDEAHRRVLDACADADLFGTTGILGWMVTDGYQAAEKVRALHPRVATVAGGWFASVMPRLYLKDGVFDAVALGQGELTFDDLVRALACGEPLDGVPGLALFRDGEVVKTEHRAVVGFDRLPDPAWGLIDFEPYRRGQLADDRYLHYMKMPAPPWIGRTKPYVGISYFSSFGCPEPCTFCCSPFVTDRRWKAKPADKILDDLEHLRDRWGPFDVVRFHDANFGVAEKRTRAFAEGLLERGMKVGWNAFIETHSVNSYAPSTLDLCAESGYYLAEIGAETGDPATMKRMGKPITVEDNYRAAALLYDRGIWSSVCFIIGFPGESEESMMATLKMAARTQLRCPEASTHILPFRPIPGNEMYEQACELGFEPPDDIHAWGGIGKFNLDLTWDNIPSRVMQARRLHDHYTTVFKAVGRSRSGLFERLAAWRLRRSEMRLPLDAKLFTIAERIRRRGVVAS